jgi:hypothetical protein
LRSAWCKSKALCSLAAMSWQWPNNGSRMNREVHVRFWESPEVKILRATRQNEPSPYVRVGGSFRRKRPWVGSFPRSRRRLPEEGEAGRAVPLRRLVRIDVRARVLCGIAPPLSAHRRGRHGPSRRAQCAALYQPRGQARHLPEGQVAAVCSPA